MNRKPNLKDVAELAGVSAITVSRVLTHPDKVAAKSRQKVEQAIAELGYIRNHAASALASNRSGVLAVIIPSLSNIVFNEVLQGIYSAVKPHQLQVILGDCHYSPLEEEKLIATLLSQAPEGLILTGTDQTDYARKLLQNAGIPVVQLMELTDNPIDINIGFSHFAAGQAMTEHLLARGYRRIGFLGARMDPRTQHRLAGFRKAIEDWNTANNAENSGAEPSSACCEPYVVTTSQSSSIKLGGQLLQSVMAESAGQCDAVFCCNDDLALGALFAARQMNLRIPADLAIAGFNDLEASALVDPGITSVASPRFAMGQQAVELILQKASGAQTEFSPLDVGFSIMVRGST
ncbi:LacI family DNA-binding transcriptional regulator [Rheinheimera sp.]|uniref:LacI family DNA-binding transcriptional regulator n=1 Tax=Rheinheimera sp. TaxID=1869214 RepID=UPI003D2AFE5D